MSKNLVIEAADNTALVRIKYEGGGEAPAELQGLWTNPMVAKEAIKVWQSKNPDRDLEVKVKRDEADTTSRK